MRAMGALGAMGADVAAAGRGGDNKGLVVGEGDQAAIQQFQRRKVFAEQLFADPPEL